MMTIVGTRETSFTGNDGRQVEGVNFYVTYQLDGCTGLAAERIFISKDKLGTFPFVPKVGDQVIPLYNRYGKVDLFQRPPAAEFPNEKVK